MMEAVPQEVRFTVEFVPGQRHYDLNRVLLHLGLGNLDCDVNQLIFLTSWAVGRPVFPTFLIWQTSGQHGMNSLTLQCNITCT